MDWHAEERLLWALEMARSERDFEKAVRAGLVPEAPAGDFKARNEDALTRSRSLIVASRVLREESISLRLASAQLRTGSCVSSLLKRLSAAKP
jgi:hypothetical protein